MKVTLYRYIGDSDVANKLLRKCTVIYDREVIPYGAFNPNGASFRLDTLHDVNYAKFTYNSHDYYGYVDVNTDSKGIYNYTITTDPLTTAWYAGCFNTGNLCKYSDLGSNNNLQDTRVAYSHGATTERLGYFEAQGYRDRPVGSFDSNYVVMVILHPDYNSGSTSTQNPAFDVYLMYDRGYAALIKNFQKLTDKEQNVFAGCIIKLYTLPSDIGWNLKQGLTSQKYIDLYSVNASTSSAITQITLNIDESVIFKLTEPKVTYNTFGTTSLKLNSMNASNFQDSIILDIADAGLISIRPTDILKTAALDDTYDKVDLTYNRYYDFVGGQQAIIPYIVSYNSTNAATRVERPLMQYRINSPIASSFPFMFDSSITNWYSVVASTTLGIMSTVANTVAQNYATAASSAVATIGNLAGNIQEARYGTASISGSTGGSLSNVIGDINNVYWVHRTPTNINDIQGKFGKPDGLVRVIGNMTGWVQTEACHLPSNGLAFNIVNQAEQLSDQGFRIVV